MYDYNNQSYINALLSPILFHLLVGFLYLHLGISLILSIQKNLLISKYFFGTFIAPIKCGNTNIESES